MRIVTPSSRVSQDKRYATLRRQHHHCPECLQWMIRDRKKDLFLCLGCGRKETRAEFTQTVRRNRLTAIPNQTSEKMLRQLLDEPSYGVVYYVKFGDAVKIGTSMKLNTRLDVIPWDEVLLTEPGGYRLEKARHKKFARSHRMREWFNLTPELQQFIDEKREELKDVNERYWQSMPAFPWPYGTSIPRQINRTEYDKDMLLYLANEQGLLKGSADSPAA